MILKKNIGKKRDLAQLNDGLSTAGAITKVFEAEVELGLGANGFFENGNQNQELG